MICANPACKGPLPPSPYRGRDALYCSAVCLSFGLELVDRGVEGLRAYIRQLKGRHGSLGGMFPEFERMLKVM